MTTKPTEKKLDDTAVAPSNTRLWDALGKTDPKHTKQFSRAGGFKGTAIKPIWTSLRLTEYFGPCGLGWGMDKPEHTTLTANNEGLVFCTVGLWYIDPASSARGQVYGVGGDKYLINQSNGLRTSDEAFKAAYTDALSNAMKQIGVAADVHMGLFEDTKYVFETAAEFRAEEAPPPPAPPAVEESPEQQERRATADRIKFAITEAKSVRNLDAIWKLHEATMEDFKTTFPPAYKALNTYAVKRKEQLTQEEGTAA